MKSQARFVSHAGIAIGPILFVIAMLAILAAAIAAGSGSFTGGTSLETAKVEASKIIDFGNRVHDAVDLMRGRYQIPDYGWSPQHNACGWNNLCLDSTCTIFCDSGSLTNGSLNCLPDIILPTTDFTPTYVGTGTQDRGDINFVLMQNVGTPGKGQIVLILMGLNTQICAEINRQLGYGSVTPVEPNFGRSIYEVQSPTITDPTGAAIGSTATQFAGVMNMCIGNGNFGGTEFDYIQVLVVR